MQMVKRNQSSQSKAYDGTNLKIFKPGDTVMYKQYKINKNYTWEKGMIIKRLGKYYTW